MTMPKGPPVSRRGFLKGASAAVATTAAACATTETNGSKGLAEPIRGPDAVGVRWVLNGKPTEVIVEPRTTLADALRDQLGLTGTKVVCDRAACSACTVFLDGMPVLACSTLAIEAEGRDLKTVEGLSAGDRLNIVQQKFVEHDAAQCGFCTPGMVMSCTALLERNPSPSVDDVKQAISGNLCRCGTYPKVVSATLDAAKSKGA